MAREVTTLNPLVLGDVRPGAPHGAPGRGRYWKLTTSDVAALVILMVFSGFIW